MKKIIVMAAMAAVLFASCGTSKKTTVSSTKSPSAAEIERGEALSDEPCIVLAEEKPVIRKYGNGQHFKEMTSRNIAEAQALSDFARSIAAAVITATEDIGVSLDKYAGDDETGAKVADQSGETNDFAMSVASEIIRNTHVIKTSRYFKSNKQYNIYVCIEYMGTENQLVEQVENSVKDKISAADREKLEQRHDKFRQRVLSDLR